MINLNLVIKSLSVNGENVSIIPNGVVRSHDLTDRYSFIFKSAKYTKEISLSLPAIIDNSFIMNGNELVGVPMIVRPVLEIEGKSGKSRVVTLNPICHHDPRIVWSVNKRGTVTMWVYRTGSKGNVWRKPFSKLNIMKDRLEGDCKFNLRPVDRADFNKLTGSTETDLHINANDLDLLMSWFKDSSKTDLDWRELEYLRAVTLEDMMAYLFNSFAAECLTKFDTNGVVDTDKFKWALHAWLSGSSQVQLDDKHQELAKLSLRTKVRLPIDRYDELDSVVPHASWAHAFCVVHTPQSSDAGAIVHLVEGAMIVNGRVIPDAAKRIFSAPLHRALPFPGFIQANRIIMVGAIEEQTCLLGDEGMYDQRPLVDVDCDPSIPHLSGRNVVLALMDLPETHEDACVISRSMAKLYTTDVIVRQVVYSTNPMGIQEYKEGGAWLVNIGDKVSRATDIAHVIIPPEKVKVDIIGENQVTLESNGSRQIRCHKYYSNLTGIVQEFISRTECKDDLTVYRNEILVKCTHFCNRGAKLAGRHSNKHIVAKIVDDNKMPYFFLPNKQKVIVDMVASPNTVGGRMNPSLVLEMMYGMVHRFVDGNTPQNYMQFDEDNSFEAAAGSLAAVDYPEDCMFQLNIEGKKLPHKTLVGVSFVSRLHHHAPDKLRMADEMEEDMHDIPRYGTGAQGLARDELTALLENGAHSIIKEVTSNSKSSNGRDKMNSLLNILGYEMASH